VIWPCMLFSCDIPLPKTVFCHGFVNDQDGRKMSKSEGNVVDPEKILEEHSPDALRYFAMREGAFGSDIAFKLKSLIVRHDTELQATLGNLVQRGFKLAETVCGGKVPTQAPEPLFDLDTIKKKIDQAYCEFNISAGIEIAFEQLREVNDWLAKKEPWKLKEDRLEEKSGIIRTVLEAIFILSHFLFPVIPAAMQKVFEGFHREPTTLLRLVGWENLKPGDPVTVCSHLFPRIEDNKFVKRTKAEQDPTAPKPQAAPPKGKNPPKEDEQPLDAKKIEFASWENCFL